MNTERGTKTQPRPSVTVRVWTGQDYIEMTVPGPLSVYGKTTKRGSK